MVASLGCLMEGKLDAATVQFDPLGSHSYPAGERGGKNISEVRYFSEELLNNVQVHIESS